jgi:glycosyltransferase involved in cell wall biosynthesis
LQRSDFGLSNHAVLWISVGTRLHDEISANWASDMLNLLERYPNVHWLLVGVNTLPAVLNGENSQRIHALGYRTDVIDVLDIADIYLNPPRIGGGFSVAEAMGQGLPVVTFTNSDGGHKVGPQAVSTQQQYIHLLSQLTAHKAERQAFGEVLRERFNRDLDLAQAGDSLKAALETTCKVAAKRLQK